jgi:hypothetical protein
MTLVLLRVNTKMSYRVTACTSHPSLASLRDKENCRMAKPAAGAHAHVHVLEDGLDSTLVAHYFRG